MSTRQGGAEIALAAARSSKGDEETLGVRIFHKIGWTARLEEAGHEGPLFVHGEGHHSCPWQRRKDLRVASIPLISAMDKSMRTRSGRHVFTASMAEAQPPAFPTTSYSALVSSKTWRESTKTGWSSTRKTLSLRIGKANLNGQTPGALVSARVRSQRLESFLADISTDRQ